MPTESAPIELDIVAPDFQLRGTDDKIHSLKDYSSNKILVLGFTCNHCPYVQAYESRLMDLVSQFKSKGVAFVCINSNDASSYPEDSFEKMKERAKNLHFNFDYLRDESQEVAKAYNAACTPEFYIYDSARMLKYHGRIDDNHKNPEAVKHTYMKDVLEDLLADQIPRFQQTAAMGCSIKWRS